MSGVHDERERQLTVDDGYQLKMLSLRINQCLLYLRALFRTERDPERTVVP